MMKRWFSLLLMLTMFACGLAAAQADQTGITEWFGAETAAQEEAQFPFIAETNELAVNIRRETSTKSATVGRLERGTQLTVLSAKLSSSGEVWYAVELKDGTQGYIRSDLLIEADEAEIVKASYQGTDRQTASAEKKSSISASYIGNRNTKKFHLQSCRTLPALKNQVEFPSREKAISSGYVPCKNCSP